MQYFLGLSGYTYNMFSIHHCLSIFANDDVEKFNEFTFLLEDSTRQLKEEAKKNAAKESDDTDSENRSGSGNSSQYVNTESQTKR